MLIWGLELPPSEISGPHSCAGDSLSPTGIRALVGLGCCFTLWDFQGEKLEYGREGGGTCPVVGMWLQGGLSEPRHGRLSRAFFSGVGLKPEALVGSEEKGQGDTQRRGGG